jgi:SAM-dependent methyltransferase
LTFSVSGKFLCNICGAECDRPPEGISREGKGCPACNSSTRMRAAIAVLSEELLGVHMTLAEFPVLKGIRGIGMSDTPELAKHLAAKLDYTNTFYHQAPSFDAVHPDPRDFGRYDFILSSEVMEHVPQPIERAFANLFQLLKPDGLLILTTPYSIQGKTKEHFPELHDFTLATLESETVLVNRRLDGSVEVFEDLVFHGGPGSTVEMRVFTEESLRETLLGVGFSSFRVASENVPEFGVEHGEIWSLPIVARKGTFHPPVAELSREYRRVARLLAHSEDELATVKEDYRLFAEHHEVDHASLEKESAGRLKWGTDLYYEMEARTKWAQTLDAELKDLRARMDQTVAEKTTLERRKWTRLGRKLGVLG